MEWNPKTYLAFAGERTRAAAELLARIDLDGPRRIADLGCGPGNSTALLAARWPSAEIEAVDCSAEMLARAHDTAIGARWVLADIPSWAPGAACDLIYSNAALHWLPDHETLLARLVSFLAPGGVLAFQVPRNFGQPSHTIALDLAKEPRWETALADVREWWTVRDPESYFAMLEPVAGQIDIWETRYLQRLAGPDAVYRWVLGSALRPYAEALAEEERESFLAEYRRRVAKAYPQHPNGVTLFPFERLFCVAVTQ